MAEPLINHIGKTRVNPTGSTLKVVGVITVKGKNYLEVECSVCSLDKDLWKSLKLSATDFFRGVLCCGCSKTPRYTSEQNKIRVVRYCEKNKLDFKGFTTDTVRSKSKIHLKCIQGHNYYPSVYRLLNNDCRCHECYLETLRRKKGTFEKSMEEHIKGFLSSRDYPEGTLFTKNTDYKDTQGKYSHWWVECPICKEDKFSKILGSPYKFSSHISGLKSGKAPCRCSRSYVYTKEEQLFRIKEIMKKRGLHFEGFVGEYKNSGTKLEYSCNLGHKVEVKVGSFVNYKTNFGGCSECNRTAFNGYYPLREEDQDYLYIIRFNEDYIKVGRSFDIKERCRSLISESGTKDLKLLYRFTSNHKTIYNTEQYLHRTLTSSGYYHKESTWTTESFCYESLHLCLELINYTNVLPC